MGALYETSYGVVPIRLLDSSVDFLVVQSRRNSHYFFPKGHKDRNKTPVQGAIRELWEESGHVPTQFWTGRDWSPESSQAREVYRESYVFRKRNGRESHKTCVYFLAQVEPRGEIQDTKEIVETRWMPATESSAEIFDFENKRTEFLTVVLPAIRATIP